MYVDNKTAPPPLSCLRGLYMTPYYHNEMDWETLFSGKIFQTLKFFYSMPPPPNPPHIPCLRMLKNSRATDKIQSWQKIKSYKIKKCDTPGF